MWKVKLVGGLLALFIIGTMIFLVLDPGGDIYNQYLSLGNSYKSGFESKKEFNYQSEIRDNQNKQQQEITNNVDSNKSEDTEKIIAMTEEEFWKYLTDDRFSSYAEAGAAWTSNPTAEKDYWNNSVTSVEVPCWKFKDYNNSDYTKVESTVSITVNKKLTQFWTDFMTDLYNLPEKYVIMSVGGFAPRQKNNKTGGLSAHTFGSTIDINAWYDGMGSAGAHQGNNEGMVNGTPFKTSVGLDDPRLSWCCTWDNSWFELAKEYGLNWGGMWTPDYMDPMHFSIVGDGSKKQEISYSPRNSGRDTSVLGELYFN